MVVVRHGGQVVWCVNIPQLPLDSVCNNKVLASRHIVGDGLAMEGRGLQVNFQLNKWSTPKRRRSLPLSSLPAAVNAANLRRWRIS